MDQGRPAADSRQEHESGCLTRLFWMVLGNVGLLVLAGQIWRHEGSFLSWADAAFWGTAAALVLLRYVDIARLGGQTALGKPATLRHWRRYALGLGLVCLAVWGLAHAAAYLRWP